jgi:hypothetical protein
MVGLLRFDAGGVRGILIRTGPFGGGSAGVPATPTDVESSHLSGESRDPSQGGLKYNNSEGGTSCAIKTILLKT